jgi:hypothetical protein
MIKYLGSTITWDLKDEIDIATMISMGHSTISRTKELFNCGDVSIRIKIIMYQAIPLNTVLWGYASWSLKEREKKKLEAFHHSAIRRILGISMRRVYEERITDKTVRSKFVGVPKISSFILQCYLQYIAKTVRNPRESALQKRFLSV